jgi:hypothetical protein
MRERAFTGPIRTSKDNHAGLTLTVVDSTSRERRISVHPSLEDRFMNVSIVLPLNHPVTHIAVPIGCLALPKLLFVRTSSSVIWALYRNDRCA